MKRRKRRRRRRRWTEWDNLWTEERQYSHE